MTTQTKCTLTLCLLFIIEILPVPFTAIYSLYVVRKRRDWVPGVVEKLYADRPVKENESAVPLVLEGHDPLVTRKRCTITLASLFVVDILVPCTIPFGLYLVRRRPLWFKNTVAKLYADQLEGSTLGQAETAEVSSGIIVNTEALEQRYLELERSNFEFARSLSIKGK